MQLAGAAARKTLLQAASKRLKFPIEQLKTDDGQVITPNNERIAYADLTEEATNIDPPKSLKLKPRSEWRYLGKSQPRLDQLSKATRTAEFGIDTRFKGMLFATIRMTPTFGCAIDEIDPTAAKNMLGVKKIVL